MSTRYLAVQALTQLFSKSEKPKEVLDKLSRQLDDRERSFLMELVYGVLRHRDALDWLLGKFLQKPSALPSDTVNNLRIALYQLRSLRVPEWAAVNEAVKIEKRKNGKAAVVNAVLRNYLRRREEMGGPETTDAVEYISITTSHPAWLIRRWIERLGSEETLKLARKNNDIPGLTIRIDGDREEAIQVLTANGIEAERTKYSPVGIIIKGRRKEGGTAATPERTAVQQDTTEYSRIALRHIPLDASSYVIQDEAAQLMSYLLDPVAGERVLDACAAPGGKTTHIARLMQDRGEVVAVDIDVGRMKKVEENVARLELKSVTVIQGDIKRADVKGLFDKVLLDAPCSSIGVIRKNPDVKYRHEEKDLKRFQSLQLDLLDRTARYLKPGGSMVYSVCSTEPEEGDEVIRYFLQRHPDFSMIEGAYTFLGHFAYRDEEGHLFYRTWPHRDNMDGFFATRLKRME
jgi:16S rRNA (cytosine967-C5)-methyltransferase